MTTSAPPDPCVRPRDSDRAQRVTAPVTLSSPLHLQRGAALPNRLARASLSENLADRSGDPTPQLVTLYRRWSLERSQGLLISGNVMVDRRHLGEPGNVVVESGESIERLRPLVLAAQSGGNQFWMQINHPGRQAQSQMTGHQPVAPSAVDPGLPGYRGPRALQGWEIEEIVARFATTARVAQLAGYDGVQLHGAHGYLISQFLSPLANQRDDEWGGDAQRRMRFVLEVLRAVRRAVGEDYPVGIKLNSADFQKGGFEEEESMAVVDTIAGEGIDLVEVSGGTYGAPAMVGQAGRESTRQREAYFQTYAEEVRRRTPGVRVMLTGGFRTRAAMQAALDADACDLVGIARSACVDPGVVPGLLDGSRPTAPVNPPTVGLRWLAGRVTDVRLLDGVVDMLWHGEQMRLLGEGKEPDLGLSWHRAVTRSVRRSGLAALRTQRGPQGRKGRR